jgi:hypothetical protein
MGLCLHGHFNYRTLTSGNVFGLSKFRYFNLIEHMTTNAGRMASSSARWRVSIALLMISNI